MLCGQVKTKLNVVTRALQPLTWTVCEEKILKENGNFLRVIIAAPGGAQLLKLKMNSCKVVKSHNNVPKESW